jgi:hypothetical protein
MTDTPPTIGLVVDCSDPALAEFWAAALDYAIVGDAGNYVALVPNGRPGPKLLLQRVTAEQIADSGAHGRGAGRPVACSALAGVAAPLQALRGHRSHRGHPRGRVRLPSTSAACSAAR